MNQRRPENKSPWAGTCIHSYIVILFEYQLLWDVTERRDKAPCWAPTVGLIKMFGPNIVFILATFLPPSSHRDFVLWTVERSMFTTLSCGWSSIICKQARYFSVSGPAGDRWGCRHSAAVLRWRESKPLTCLQDPSVSDSRGLTRSFRCASSCLDDVVFVLRDSMSPSFSANICYSGVVLYNFHRQEGRSRTPQASLTPHHCIFMRIFK